MQPLKRGVKRPSTLSLLIAAADRAFKSKPAKKQRVIMFGSGALYNWALGREELQNLQNIVADRVAREGAPGHFVEVHWLGYPKIDAPFGADATLSSVVMSASWVQEAVRYFTDAIIDFVCFSLSGLMTLYWALEFATPNELARVNSITTINSPLKPYPMFSEEARNYLRQHGTFFGRPQLPPLIKELEQDSFIPNRVIRWDAPIYLFNISTEGDEIVPPELAVVENASEKFSYSPPLLTGRLKIHSAALDDAVVQDKIVRTICTPHLPQLGGPE